VGTRVRLWGRVQSRDYIKNYKVRGRRKSLSRTVREVAVQRIEEVQAHEAKYLPA